MTAKAYKRLNLLRHLSSLWKKPKPNTMICLYNSILRPIFEYGSICFVNAAEVHLDKLQLVQNQALRVVMKSPRYMAIKDLHDCTGSLPMRQHLICHARKRLETMKRTSPILHNVIQEYQNVRHIHENASPLDIIFQ